MIAVMGKIPSKKDPDGAQGANHIPATFGFRRRPASACLGIPTSVQSRTARITSLSNQQCGGPLSIVLVYFCIVMSAGRIARQIAGRFGRDGAAEWLYPNVSLFLSFHSLYLIISRKSRCATSVMVRESRYLLLSSLLISSSIALERARLAPQSLVSRANYEGSWALGIPGSECPSDTPVTCSQSSIATLECCPSGNTCFGLSSSYCCPSSTGPSS